MGGAGGHEPHLAVIYGWNSEPEEEEDDEKKRFVFFFLSKSHQEQPVEVVGGDALARRVQLLLTGRPMNRRSRSLSPASDGSFPAPFHRASPAHDFFFKLPSHENQEDEDPSFID